MKARTPKAESTAIQAVAGAEMSPGPPRSLALAVFGLTAGAWCALILFIVLYARFGFGFVQGAERRIGDILMDEGIRLENAGMTENAISTYLQASEERFTHPENRTETLMHLGNLVLWRDGPEHALPYLEEAFNEGNYTIWLYGPLCEALLGAGRAKEALDIAGAWFEKAAEQKDLDKQAEAKFFQGKAWKALGNNERAIEAYSEGNAIKPGGLNAYYAGVMSYEAGKLDEALSFIETYLKEGTGESAAWAAELRKRILDGKTGASVAR